MYMHVTVFVRSVTDLLNNAMSLRNFLNIQMYCFCSLQL